MTMMVLHGPSFHKMNDENSDAYEWLMKIHTHLLSRHAMNLVTKVEHISNNVAESLNSWINKNKELPILSPIEAYKLKIMKHIHSRFQHTTSWKEKLGPDAVKKLNEEWSEARCIDFISKGRNEFQCMV